MMTNNARKLCTGEMNDICEQETIKLHTSVRYSPESNGVAERTTGVFTNAARAMPHDSGLTRRRTYIIGCQRRHWAVVRHLRSVTGVWHLRAFGAPCAIVEPTERMRKLDDKRTVRVFMGYKYERGDHRFGTRKGELLSSPDI